MQTPAIPWADCNFVLRRKAIRKERHEKKTELHGDHCSGDRIDGLTVWSQTQTGVVRMCSFLELGLASTQVSGGGEENLT